MISRALLIAATGFWFLPAQSMDQQEEQPLQEKQINNLALEVRVLLDERLSQTDSISWKIGTTASSGWIRMYDQLNPHKRYIIKEQEIELTFHPAYGWTAKKRLIPFSTVCFEAEEGAALTIEGNPYPGKLTFQRNNNTLLLINSVPLETYVESVLNTESWPGWPLEVNKAFAIASRSYVVAKLLKTRPKNAPFDVKCTNKHQTYSGACNKEKLKIAVQETKGIILTHNKKPVEAMFDACCGGVIPGHIEGVNFKKAPYLARATQCTFCSDSKIAKWNFSCSVAEFEKIIKENGVKLTGKLQRVFVQKKDKAGVVQNIEIKGGKSSVNLPAKSLYAWFKPIKSNSYQIEQKGKMLHFRGRGYGHHLGICQWGARKMIDFGKNFVSILTYYYPGTTLATLIHTSFDGAKKL